MTPTALPTLLPAAPAATDLPRRAAPADEPATFASVLDGSIQALSAGGEQADGAVQELAGIEAGREGGTDADPLQAGAEAAARASEQPRLDALALMLAAAPPPGQTTPGAAAATATATAVGVGAGAAVAAAVAPAAAAPARTAFGGTAVAMSRPTLAGAPAARPDAGDGARPAEVLPAAIGADAAADAMQAATAPSPAAQRREAHTLAAGSRQAAALAAADVADGAVAAAGPRPAASAVASAPTLSVPVSPQGTAQAAAAAIGNAAPRAAAQRPAPDPERGPVPIPATRALQSGPIAAQDAPPPETQVPVGMDVAAPGGLASPAAASAPAATGVAAHVAPPVGSPDWAPALAQQLVRLPGGGAVELHLNPVELGPLQVKLSVVEGQAQVLFVAEHAAVRQALEAALPQLRTSLAENGINLGHANVGSGAAEQRAGQDGGERRAPGSERETPARADEPAAAAGSGRAHLRATSSGAVDTFA